MTEINVLEAVSRRIKENSFGPMTKNMHGIINSDRLREATLKVTAAHPDAPMLYLFFDYLELAELNLLVSTLGIEEPMILGDYLNKRSGVEISGYVDGAEWGS